MKYFFLASLLSIACGLNGQNATVSINSAERFQVIDGFGAHQGSSDANQAWWLQLFYDDMACSIYRVDLTPRLVSPYSDLRYHSPWFMGSQTNSIFNLEDPDNPNGPENNRVRTYTGPNDYSRTFGGLKAPIAIMGPDAYDNVGKFVYSDDQAITVGKAKKEELGDFKLIGSLWSPVPWVKVSTGKSWDQNWWPGPVQGAAWPFIWGGNFAGGKLDVSGIPLAVFDDTTVGGTGPTSSLTQFARSSAAYILGYQEFHDMKFYAISIQNELNFEQFYNSAFYPLSSQYITAVKAIKDEFAKYPELADILIMGPEDLLGGDPYGMWEYGSSVGLIHKNLQYLKNIEADAVASEAVDFYCIHGYGSDGVNSAGLNSEVWDQWANGWAASPAPGIPGNIKGFMDFGKKSWMTETSGELEPWLIPAAGFPSNGGWSIALKMHQALTTGMESAWVYWTFTGLNNGQLSDQALTSEALGANSPKYVAAKHFFKWIRPNAQRTACAVTNTNTVQASSYIHDADGTMTIVLINSSNQSQTANLQIAELANKIISFDSYTSSNNSYWKTGNLTLDQGASDVFIPAYGVITLVGNISTSTAASDPIMALVDMKCLPNPTQGKTRLMFTLSKSETVQVNLTDLNGKIVWSTNDIELPAGKQQINLDTETLEVGVYFVRLIQEGKTQSIKLVVSR